MKKLNLAVSLLATALVSTCGIFSVTAAAVDDYPYFIKDGDIKGFRNWEETLDYINRHGNDETDYTIYIDEDTTVIDSMKFPSNGKAKSLTFKGVPNNFSSSPDNYDYSQREDKDAVHTINLKGIKSLKANCDIIFENIMLDSDMPFTFSVKNDITIDTNFVASNLSQLKGSSKSTFWINVPEDLDTSVNYYPFDEGGNFSTANFKAEINGKDMDIEKYVGSDKVDIKVPAEAYGAHTNSIAVNAFADVKNTMKTIAFESGSDYLIESGTCKGYTALEEVYLGTYVDVAGGAFENCTGINKVTFTRGFYSTYLDRTVKSGAFKGCTNLKELVVPSKYIVIEKNAFEDCPIEKLSMVGGFETIFAETNGLALNEINYLTGSTPNVAGLAKLIENYGGIQTINITDVMYEAMKSDPNWTTYQPKIEEEIAPGVNRLVISEVPVIIPTLNCNYEVSGFNEVRPEATIRINAFEKFKVNYLILDNDNTLSVYDKKVTLKYLIAANKTNVSLLYNDDFQPIEITGEALCTNSVKLMREKNGEKAEFDWDSIVLIGKNLVPDDMFYVDPECLEANGTIPYLLSKEKKNIYLRRLAFKLSGKNGDGSPITPIFFSQWKDMVTYIEENTSGADILISVLSDTNLGAALKMPKKGSYATLTMTGGDFARVENPNDSTQLLAYKGYALPDLSLITLPEGQSLSMVDFADIAYAADHSFIDKAAYEQTIERRAVTFWGHINLTGDTRLVDLKLNNKNPKKDYYDQLNINAGKYVLMMDKIYSDGYIKNVKSSGEIYLAGGNTNEETMRFIGSLNADNLYFFNGYVRADKEIVGKSSVQTFNSNLIDLIDTDNEGNPKNFVNRAIDTANVVDIYTRGIIKTKLLNSSNYVSPTSTVLTGQNLYATITLNPAKISTVDTFGKTSAQIYLKLTDNFDNRVKPTDGEEIIKIKGDYLRNQLIYKNYSGTFEIVRANKYLKTGKVGYGYYMIDTSSTNTGNAYYANYRYAYATLNDAVIDLNRMMSAAEYTIELPKFVRQIPKLTKLKAGSHSGTIKLVVDPDILNDSSGNGYVQDKDYVIGVKKNIMKILSGGTNGTSEYDWESDITIDVDDGSPVTALPNPIRIYTE